MTAEAQHPADPRSELRHRRLDGREARVAVFTRSYDAPIEDVWDACTNPARLRRWYAPVTGELRAGGTFNQPPMGSGVIVRCDPPRKLTLSLGGGSDEIDLQLSEAPDGRTALELQHATTTADHEIDGQVFDAIFCMGGGYYPRLVALDEHLRKALPHDYDPVAFHERPDRRAIIDRGSAAMANLLRGRRETAVGR